MGPAPGGLTLDLGTVARPVILVGFNVNVLADAGASWNGALFLDPGSRLEDRGLAPLHVAHLSYAAASAAISANAVVADLGAPAALEALGPSVRHVCTEALTP